LQVGRKLAESLAERAIALRRGSGGGLGSRLLQGGKVGLRAGQIPGLEILPELLKFLLKLLPAVLDALATQSEQVRA
jgi:hypothetical protein